jgi:AraC family transcriptional regulator of adaptative response/methylated-DNA-[protein]-cysteine methyltransferase
MAAREEIPVASVASVASRPPTTGSDARWEAVRRRDPGADGAFVYSVASTGVYCRPSCPSRQPRRENVAFHADPAAAEAAGFRACLRCDPRGASLTQRQAALIAAACRQIESAEEAPSLAALARTAGLSRFHFHRLFKTLTGVTPKAYAAAWRGQQVRAALARGSSVTEAFHGAGYNSGSRFYAEAAEQLGMQPKAYRDGGRGITVRFAVGECSLGSVLVAASTRGVCAILLGDDPEALLRELQDQFPQANLVGAEPDFETTVAHVIGLIEAPGSAPASELPLDIRGTAFQRQVWEALCRIPSGATKTYAQIAQIIGRPRAVRAVGQACGSNLLAVAIPCHRVVRTGGDLSGYRWGIERKRALLDRERFGVRRKTGDGSSGA